MSMQWQGTSKYTRYPYIATENEEKHQVASCRVGLVNRYGTVLVLYNTVQIYYSKVFDSC
jgi:hypothetical protein